MIINLKNNMKDQSKVNTIAIIILSLLLIIVGLSGCKTKYAPFPVETIKTEKEYIDKWHRDSIHVTDSIIINKAGDTIYIEKYKYIYKDKFVRDSIFITDSIKVDIPYPVEVVKEVNHLHNWQIILMCLGGVLIGYVGFRVIKKIKT